MKAVLWTGYGGAEVLVPGEVEIPDIKENEILVKVKASTVTMGDCEIRGLKLPLAFTLPIRLYFGFLKPRMGILGQEFSGIVEKTGKKVSKFKPGDKIFGQTGFSMGAYAQYLKVKENAMIIKKPDNLSFEEAAAIPLGSLESWYFLKRAEVKKGDHILIIGAGGSIGTIGIQLSKMLGAKVTGVDSFEKFDVMKAAGADTCIDYNTEDYFSSGLKYQVIFDVVGKNELRESMALLKDGGVYLHANPKIRQMLFKFFIKKGNGKRLIIKKPEEEEIELEEITGFASKEIIKPIIDRSIGLDEVAWAHEYVEAGRKKGSLVVLVDENHGT